MSVDSNGYGTHLYDAIRDVLYYRQSELWWVVKHLVVLLVASAIVVMMWERGWEESFTWHMMYIVDDLLPVSGHAWFVFPFTFLLGMVSALVFDTYKRLQGLLLFVPTVILVGYLLVYLNRMRITWSIDAYAVGAVGLLAGLYATGFFDEVFEGGENEFEQGFKRLTGLVVGLGILGWFEANLDYVSPLQHRNWITTTFLGYEFPLEVESFQLHGIDSAASPLMTFAEPVAIIALGIVLWQFTEYEIDKNVVLIGPDRAGKTWLMGGTAYCLRQERDNSVLSIDPEFNEELKRLYKQFRDKRFDEIDSTDPGELRLFKLTYAHGLIVRRRVTVRMADYSGEILPRITHSPEEAGEAFESEFSEGFPEKLAEFEETVRPNLQDPNNPDKAKERIAAFMSKLVAEADTIGLVFPMDDCIRDLPDFDDFEDNDLPDYQSVTDLPKKERQVDMRAYRDKYDELMEERDGDTDIFFVPTLCDLFLKDFGRDPKANWSEFREHVTRYLMLEDSSMDTEIDRHVTRDVVEHVTRDVVDRVYPVYFKAKQNSNGDFEPRLGVRDGPEDRRWYSLRGLREFLIRLGR